MSITEVLQQLAKNPSPASDNILPLMELEIRGLLPKGRDGLYERKALLYRFAIQMRDFIDDAMVYLYLTCEETWMPAFHDQMLVFKTRSAVNVSGPGIEVPSLLEIAIYNGLAPEENW